MTHRLSIILVNYKQADLTAECVNSIRKSSFTDYQIIIVDNESDPSTFESLKRSCGDAVIIRSAKNLGFGGGNNLGIQQALRCGDELILLLNNDTVIDENLLKILVETADSIPSAGIIGASIYYFEDRDRLWYAGGRLNVDKALGTHIGIGSKESNPRTEVTETDFVTGCCLLTRRTVLEEIGTLDEKFFLYLEDADFSVRAKSAGYRVLYQPAAKLYHKVSHSTSLESPTYIYFNLRNKILFLKKNSKMQRWIWHLPYFIYFYGRQFVRLILKHPNFRAFRAAVWGLKDGLANFTGESGEGRLDKL